MKAEVNMNASIWAAALAVYLFSGSSFAQGPVATFTAKCDGGRVALAHESLVVRITAEAVVFIQGPKQIAVPASHIAFVAYSDSDDGTQLAGIQWNDPAGDIVLVLQRQDYSKVVTALKTMYERARASKEETSIDNY
jgi:hypothetical protein